MPCQIGLGDVGWGCNSGGANASELRQRGDAGQGLALHPFQKRATGRGDIAEIPGNPRLIQCCHRIASAGHGNQLARLGQGGRLAGGGVCGDVEGFDLEPFQTRVFEVSITCPI